MSEDPKYVRALQLRREGKTIKQTQTIIRAEFGSELNGRLFSGMNLNPSAPAPIPRPRPERPAIPITRAHFQRRLTPTQANARLTGVMLDDCKTVSTAIFSECGFIRSVKLYKCPNGVLYLRIVMSAERSPPTVQKVANQLKRFEGHGYTTVKYTLLNDHNVVMLTNAENMLLTQFQLLWMKTLDPDQQIKLNRAEYDLLNLICPNWARTTNSEIVNTLTTASLSVQQKPIMEGLVHKIDMNGSETPAGEVSSSAPIASVTITPQEQEFLDDNILQWRSKSHAEILEKLERILEHYDPPEAFINEIEAIHILIHKFGGEK
jgi:hypothetical protein